MKKHLKLIIVITVFIIVLILLVRIFSGEDNWVCSNGKWIKHGNPSDSMPNQQCLK